MTMSEIEFEKMVFKGESEYRRFCVWIFDLVARGQVEKVEARSTNFTQRNFFRIKGETQIWALADPIDSEYVDSWGSFSPLRIIPVNLEEKTFYTSEEFNRFVAWLEEKVSQDSIVELGQEVLGYPRLALEEKPAFKVYRAAGDGDIWVLTEPTNGESGGFKNTSDVIRRENGWSKR